MLNNWVFATFLFFCLSVRLVCHAPCLFVNNSLVWTEDTDLFFLEGSDPDPFFYEGSDPDPVFLKGRIRVKSSWIRNPGSQAERGN